MTTTLRPDEALFRAPVDRGQRSKGRSAVAAAAYRSGERLTDDRTGRTFDYRRKQSIVDKLILAPADAPAWTQDRGQLWSRVEKAERRKDAQTWIDFEVTIPRDIPRDRWRAIAAEVVRPYVDMGAVADAAMHAPAASDGEENGHIHIMVTPRTLDASGPQGFARLKMAVLERPDEITAYRYRVADILNDHLRAVGSPRRCDPRSYAERGDDRIPEPKIGEREIARYRRQSAAHRVGGPPPRPSRRLGRVAAVRRLKRQQNKLLEEEIAMTKEAMGISKIPFAEKRQEVKDRLLRERFPDLNISRAGIAADSIYRVDVSKPEVTRILMRDDSMVEVRGGRVRLYGPDGDARALGQAIAQAQGWDAADVIERLPERARAAAPKGRYKRREDKAAEIERLCRYWEQAGFTDISTCTRGVWIAIGSTRILDSGDRISVHGAPTDDVINAMLDKAAQEWSGRCEIYGDDDFKARFYIAARLREPPIEVSGYSPPDHVQAQLSALQKRRERQADSHQAAVAAVASVGDRANEARALQSWLNGDTKTAPVPVIAAAVADLSEAERMQIAAAPVFEIIPRLDGWRRQGEEKARAAEARLDAMPPIPSEREFAAATIAYAAGEREHAMLDRLTAYVDSLDPAERWAVGQMSVDEAVGHLDEWREIGKDLWVPPDLAEDEPPPPSEDDYGSSGPRL